MYEYSVRSFERSLHQTIKRGKKHSAQKDGKRPERRHELFTKGLCEKFARLGEKFVRGIGRKNIPCAAAYIVGDRLFEISVQLVGIRRAFFLRRIHKILCTNGIAEKNRQNGTKQNGDHYFYEKSFHINIRFNPSRLRFR